MSKRSRDYKSLTYPQLRSFRETARLGGMTAAAESLGIAQPTVWKQIHSLEAHFGVPLVEPHTRGCRLTAAGQLLLRMAGPLVGEMESLSARFRAAVGRQSRRLAVSANPRPCEEELLPCVLEYERRFPHVRLVLRQLSYRNEVIETVKSGESDMGIVSLGLNVLPDGLHAEPIYEMEPVLLVPRGHPLAKVKIRLEHFAKYPLISVAETYPDPALTATLKQVGAYNHPGRRVELHLARTIRLYVKHGMGIGIVSRAVGAKPEGDVIERSLYGLFGCRQQVYAVYRQRVTPDTELLDFIQVLRDQFSAQ